MRLILFAILTSGAVFAQSSFEVASVRPNPTGVNSSKIERSGGRIILQNTSLRDAVGFAYDIPVGRDYQLSGPAWIDSEKFDITATFPADTSRDRVREMLQKLLIERFGLQTHNETKDFESYALTVTKTGPKLKRNAVDDDGAFTYGPEHVACRAISMGDFADRLSGQMFKLDRPVVDLTELKGSWDFELSWSVEGSPSIFTAIQEQLGLRLEARKLPFRVLVIDRIDKTPTDN